MELYRAGIKLFAADPASVHLDDFIPIFHVWIQNQIIEDHFLIDIHNYSHIADGPGILLVAHQGNFSVDMSEGRPGLFYYRKQPAGSFADIVMPAMQACRLLEQEPDLNGIRFRRDDILIVANDRLVAPNDNNGFEKWAPLVGEGLREVLGSEFKLNRISAGAKERLTIQARG